MAGQTNEQNIREEITHLARRTNVNYSIISPVHYSDVTWAWTHWDRVTHICVSKLTIIGSDNGLSPERRQTIIWTNAGILLIGPLGTNFSEILIEILTFSLKKIRLKMLSVKCCSFRLGLNVLRCIESVTTWLFGKASNRRNIKGVHYWPFVRGIHQWF